MALSVNLPRTLGDSSSLGLHFLIWKLGTGPEAPCGVLLSLALGDPVIIAGHNQISEGRFPGPQPHAGQQSGFAFHRAEVAVCLRVHLGMRVVFLMLLLACSPASSEDPVIPPQNLWVLQCD